MNSLLSRELTNRLFVAAQNKEPVSGWTHNFYRYPARFSPRFVSEAIHCFSKPGNLLLDPYVGGGTTVIEAIASGRRIIGNDLNSLATFVTKVKTTSLSAREIKALRLWSKKVVPTLSYCIPFAIVEPLVDLQKIRNLTTIRARFIKKAIAAALVTIERLPTDNSIAFARCALLCVAQKALDGRRRQTPLPEFRFQLGNITNSMLDQLDAFQVHLRQNVGPGQHCEITNEDASQIHRLPVFAELGEKVSLVVTSPPYPGVHVLYHRWQVDGRRETPAPYWIAGMQDGQAESYYNLGDRKEAAANSYFEASLRNLRSVRTVMKRGAFMVQMLAFAEPARQLPRYLATMEAAGFAEILPDPTVATETRIWRNVPNRKWYASIAGKTHSSKEVVLIHKTI